MSECIEFVASIARVQTLADGGIRVVLDLPEDAIAQAAMLMQVRMADEVVSVTCEAGERKEVQGYARRGRISGILDATEGPE